MDFDFNEIKTDYKKCVAEKDAVISTHIADSDSGVVNKILGVSARGRIVNIDGDGDMIRCSGRINFKLLYIGQDDEIKGLDYFADFTENFNINTLSDNLCGLISIIDTDVNVDNGIKLSAMIHISLYGVEDTTFSPLIKTDDEVYAETKEFSFMHYVVQNEYSFKVSDEYDTKSDVQKILFTDVQSVIERATPGMGNILFTGSVNGRVTYKANDQILVEAFCTPFSEEVDVEGVEIGDVIDAIPSIKNTRVTLSGVEGSNVIRLENEIEICYKVFEKTSTNIVTDVFSVEKELNVTCDKVLSKTFYNSVSLKDSILGIAEIAENSKAVLEVIGITTNSNTVAQVIKGDDITVEGIYFASILYRDEDGVTSVDVEIPYSIPFKIENSGGEFSGVGVVAKAECKLKRAREIEVSAELGFIICENLCEEIAYISKVEEGDEKAQNMSAVSVYIADSGETIYDVAKALSARPDEINAQNPTVTSPYKKGDKLFFFRGITFEF